MMQEKRARLEIQTERGPSLNGAGPEMLREILPQFESQLRTAGFPVERLAPGISRGELEDELSETGLTIPDEVCALLGWHNGMLDDTWLVPRFQFASASMICRDYVATWPPHGTEEWQWNPTWLRLMGPNLGGLAVRCDADQAQPPLVRVVSPEWSTQPDFVEHQVVSLCTPVSWWIDALKDGAIRFNGTWERDRLRIPMQRQVDYPYV